MPGRFTFEKSNLSIADEVLFPTQLSTGNTAAGLVNDPSQFSAVTPLQTIDPDADVDIFAIPLLAGQQYTFDIDRGVGGFDGVDTEVTLIDLEGNLVASNDDADDNDPGSILSPDGNNLDSLLTFTPTRTGVYFLAVHDFEVDYPENGFLFEEKDLALGQGDYQLVVSTPDLPALVTLGAGNNNRSFDDAAQRIAAGAGNDILNLGGGNDIADGQEGNDTLNGAAGDDQLAGSAGNDGLHGGADNDALLGGTGNDTATGGDGNDDAFGGDGNDLLRGGVGDDRLWGEDGDDQISGQLGNDFIRGGRGLDTTWGGGGADTFHYLLGEANLVVSPNGEKIQDFDSSDVIDLSDVFDGTLTFLGTAPFTGAAGEVRIVDQRDGNGDGFQQVRVNADDAAGADLAILVDTVGNFDLSAGDFIL